jgi:hypothetical protein
MLQATKNVNAHVNNRGGSNVSEGINVDTDKYECSWHWRPEAKVTMSCSKSSSQTAPFSPDSPDSFDCVGEVKKEVINFNPPGRRGRLLFPTTLNMSCGGSEGYDGSEDDYSSYGGCTGTVNYFPSQWLSPTVVGNRTQIDMSCFKYDADMNYKDTWSCKGAMSDWSSISSGCTVERGSVTEEGSDVGEMA